MIARRIALLLGLLLCGAVELATAQSFSTYLTGRRAATGDPYWTSVKLLMGFEGANDSTGSPGMDDESSAAHGTASGGDSAHRISTGQKKFGVSSLFQDSPGHNAFPDSDDWHFGTGNFTVEFFFRSTSIGNGQRIIGQYEFGSNGWLIYIVGSQINVNFSTDGSNWFHDIICSTTLSSDAWYYFALDFDGTKYRAYIDGAVCGSSTTLRTLNDSNAVLQIGSDGLPYVGYLDELRITKGFARCSNDAGCEVPTAAFPRGGSWLLQRDLNPANDNSPAFLDKAA